MQPILVVGGAGYIGAHTCLDLAGRGFLPVTYDNLSTGHDDFVRWGPLEVGDIRDGARLDAVLQRHRPVAIVHFAAQSEIGRSIADPLGTYAINVGGTVSLLAAAERAGIDKLVFSSTCATYGEQDNVVLDEDSPQQPLNAYGASKRAIEDILRDFDYAFGLKHVIFRYFNVAGADPEAEVGEFHQPETHLVPLMLDAIAGKRPALTLHGTDYDTPDGTCIRDYVHVCDLVDAHVLGLKWLQDKRGSRVFNLGTGRGFSVREVVDASRAVTNTEVPITEGPRRAGDATKLVSGSTRAEAELGWQPQRSTLDQMIADAWRWQRTGHYER